MADSRYPYTYACDFVRAAGPVGSEGVVLSRSDASQICRSISNALGMENHELACKLADAQLVNEENPEELKRQTARLMAALGYNAKEGDFD
jgi:hypothetical protein